MTLAEEIGFVPINLVVWEIPDWLKVADFLRL